MFRLPCDVRSLMRVSIAALALVGGCGHAFWRTEVVALTRPPAGLIGPVAISSPVKAHLVDGSTVIFRRGASIGYVAVEGDGMRFPFLQAAPSGTVSRVAFDSIVGPEPFEGTQLV